jgi:hypothetical protein
MSGFVPYQDIDIKFSGLRPGEKLYEELLMDEEGLQDTENKLIHIGKPIKLDEEKFLKDLDNLYMACLDEPNPATVRKLVGDIVPTYKPKNPVDGVGSKDKKDKRREKEEVKTEIKAETKTEVKDEVKAETKAEVKDETKADDVKTDISDKALEKTEETVKAAEKSEETVKETIAEAEKTVDTALNDTAKTAADTDSVIDAVKKANAALHAAD